MENAIDASLVINTATSEVTKMAECPTKKNNFVIDKLFHKLTVTAAFLIIIIAAALFVQLFYYAFPAIKTFGIEFLWKTDWNPVKNIFGAAPAIIGTLLTAIIALLIAVPLSFFIAIFLVELSPNWINKIIGPAIDLLAAIPSIIYGIWGLFVFIPIMQKYAIPLLNTVINIFINIINYTTGTNHINLLNTEQCAYTGTGYLTGGIVLALMITPYICAVMRDVFKMVPNVVKEAGFGIGATTAEVATHITLRYGVQGVIGAVFLGLGRAIGETMAILYVIGNTPKLTNSLYEPGTTIAATLANNFAEADGIFMSTLFELGLILLLTTFIIQIISQLWLNRLKTKSGSGL